MVVVETILCDYGCEKQANYQLKNGKSCCENTWHKCSKIRQRWSDSKKAEKNPNYNKSPSIETLKKLSDSRKGKKRSPFSKTHKMNMSLARKGKKFTKRPEHSEFMKEHNPMFSIDFSGEHNPNWRGGISNNDYCSGWNTLSAEIRDYYKICQNPNCNKNESILTTHHIDYDKRNCHPNNLIALCNVCNGKANGKREYHKKFYKEIKENDY